MSETKHTPGPWTLGAPQYHVTGYNLPIEGGQPLDDICIVMCYEGAIANAKLIASIAFVEI